MQFQYRKIVFLTGAGISAESGLSLFRGKTVCGTTAIPKRWQRRKPFRYGAVMCLTFITV